MTPLLPAQAAGLTGPQALWKLQYTERGKSTITEVQPKDLATFVKAPWFVTSDDGTGVTMTAPVDGPTTSGSGYTRCEGREMTRDGEKAGWDSRKGAHRLDLWMRLDDLMVGGKVSLIQLHDELDDQIQVLVERTSTAAYRLYWSVGLGKGKGGATATIDGAFKPGAWVPTLLEVLPGKTNFYVGSDWAKPKVSTTTMRQSAKTYAKWGPYCQVKTPKGANITASFRGVTMTHDAAVTPTPAAPGSAPAPAPHPVPTPAPTSGPDTILIVRHGEKAPDSGNPTGITRDGKEDRAHSLTPDGWGRAGAFVQLFTSSRRFPKVTRFVASQGATNSRRPAQTLYYVARARALPIDLRFDFEEQVPETAAAIRAMTGCVLVCGEHSALPALARAFGADPPAVWPDGRYDVVWRLDRATGYQLTQVPQQIMPGDLATGI